ncbi:MAG: hypothetical protein JSR54_12550 [Proteobacteria bacterium]|nr:hypothetical protein [Pseudomonadota bacterium]
MQSILRTLWDIALWRGGPRELPAAGPPLVVAAIAYGATSALQSWLAVGPEHAPERGLADLAFTVLVVWLCLAVGRRPHRLAQTLLAVLGTGSLLAVPMTGVFLLARLLGHDDPLGAAVQLLGVPLIAWGLAVLAHIVRQALDAPLVVGVAVATTYYLVGYLLIEQLLPVPVS